MNFLSRLFKNWGSPEQPRGLSPDYPMLADGAPDVRNILEGFACREGHRLDVRRAGSEEGLCPNPARHMPVLRSDACIVEIYEVSCPLCAGPHATIFIDAQHPNRPEQLPPGDLTKAAPVRPARTITLDYDNDRPAWRLRTVQPSRFRNVRYKVQTRLFLMPEGALIGILFNLYDIPNQPYFIHRIMDLSDLEVEHYINSCVHHGRIVTVFESKGEEIGFRRDIELDAEKWRQCLQEGLAHNSSIDTDGDRALEIFLEAFHRISRERGVEPAWDEIALRCIHRRK